MGAVSAFTAGNYHCKPLMTDVVVIHKSKVKKEDGISAKVYDPANLCPISGTSCVHQQKGPLDTYKYSFNSQEKVEKPMGAVDQTCNVNLSTRCNTVEPRI